MLLFCQIPEMRYKDIYIYIYLWCVVYIMTCGIDDIIVLVLFMNIFII